MSIRPLTVFFLLLIFSISVHALKSRLPTPPTTSLGAPPYGESESQTPSHLPTHLQLQNWQRPDGPPKVGIQVGHWHSSDLPEELSRLRNNTGAAGGGHAEWQVNHTIAHHISTLLEAQGVQTDILPATIPPQYWADVFIAIHADGSTDTSKSGFKFASPWRDYTGHSHTLVSLLEQTYQSATNLPQDPNITRNMRGYYAFSWWRYHHSIHPMTVAAIAETGFLTHQNDRELLVNQPEIPANAIASAVLQFLDQQSLI